MRRTTFAAVSLALLTSACTHTKRHDGYGSVPPTVAATATTTAIASDAAPHVFVIMLENTTYADAFGEGAVSTYLAHEMPAMGMLLTQYHGVAHPSLPNYIAQISGQAPNPATQSNCGTYSDFVQTGTGDYGQALGQGCVYPAGVPTIADQLTAAGLTWRAYAQDMAASPGEAPTACRHPLIGGDDPDQRQRTGDAYATRHVPFLYFHSVIDSPDCAQRVVDLGLLESDLTTVATTRHLTYIVPDLCSSGHDAVCADGGAGGLIAVDAFLRDLVPRLLAAPAFGSNGLLVVTFDEAPADADASACCNQPQGPNQLEPAGRTGPGGGRTGAVLIGPHIAPGTVNDTPYNHYSLLCSLEELWGLERLGYAAHPDTACFGALFD